MGSYIVNNSRANDNSRSRKRHSHHLLYRHGETFRRLPVINWAQVTGCLHITRASATGKVISIITNNASSTISSVPRFIKAGVLYRGNGLMISFKRYSELYSNVTSLIPKIRSTRTTYSANFVRNQDNRSTNQISRVKEKGTMRNTAMKRKMRRKRVKATFRFVPNHPSFSKRCLKPFLIYNYCNISVTEVMGGSIWNCIAFHSVDFIFFGAKVKGGLFNGIRVLIHFFLSKDSNFTCSLSFAGFCKCTFILICDCQFLRLPTVNPSNCSDVLFTFTNVMGMNSTKIILCLAHLWDLDFCMSARNNSSTVISVTARNNNNAIFARYNRSQGCEYSVKDHRVLRDTKYFARVITRGRMTYTINVTNGRSIPSFQRLINRESRLLNGVNNYGKICVIMVGSITPICDLSHDRDPSVNYVCEVCFKGVSEASRLTITRDRYIINLKNCSASFIIGISPKT